MGEQKIVSVAGRPLSQEQQELLDVKIFHRLCEAAGSQLETGREGPAFGEVFQQINPSKTIVENNDDPYDGVFYLFNKDTSQDFFCQGIFNTNSGTLRLGTAKLSELISDEKGWGFDEDGFPLREECQTAQALLSKTEFNNTKCAQEGEVYDPQFVSAYQSEEEDEKSYLANLFVKECNSYYQSQIQNLWGRSKEFPKDLIQVERDTSNRFGFRVGVQDEAANFSCLMNVDVHTGRFDLSVQALQLEEAPATRFGFSVGQEAKLILGGFQEALPSYQLCLDAQKLGLAEAVGDCEKYNTAAQGWSQLLDEHPGLKITLDLAGASLGIYLVRRLVGDGAALISRQVLPRLGLRMLAGASSLREIRSLVAGGVSFAERAYAFAANGHIPFLHNWRLNTGATRLVQSAAGVWERVPLSSRLDQIYRVMTTPGLEARYARIIKKFYLIGEAVARTAGLAFATTWAYDGLASFFVGPDHWARQYGTPMVAGVSAGTLAAVEARTIAAAGRGATAKGIISRMASSRLGAAALRISNRLLLVNLTDYAFGQFVDDYKKWVYQRVTEQVYQEDGVEKEIKWLHPSDAFDLGKMMDTFSDNLRGEVHGIAPMAMEWAVAYDNPDRVQAILKQDQWEALEVRDALREALPFLAILENPNNPEAFDLNSLRDGEWEALEGEEFVLYLAVQKYSPGEIYQFFCDHRAGYYQSPEEFDAELSRVMKKAMRNSFYKSAQFLYLMGHNEDTDWYRHVFEKDGSLQRGQAENLIQVLYGSKANYQARIEHAQREVAKEMA